MRLTAVFCVYNELEYLEYAVRSIAPAVDGIVLCLGLAPYNAYNPSARSFSRPDGTEALADRLAREIPKLTLIKGTWNSEVEHRNAGLAHCLKDGTDYYWLVDGDEVYREDHLRTIREELRKQPRVGTFIVKCHIFWRSFFYRIPAEILPWRPRRIFKMTRLRGILGVGLPHRLRFIGQNEMNSLGPVYEIPSADAVFYHFSYARSRQAMEDKLKTFSHAHEIREEWFSKVWLAWPQNRQMLDIHPTDPPKFAKAIYQKPDDLPEIMRSHPYFTAEIIP
ncbi:MAG: glycosyltransferase family 2 protein [Candidatus Omnitrophica bacterium]|nr:glycosyltransferase family 2 protein [Candidatus Omnitrophota bacterium]